MIKHDATCERFDELPIGRRRFCRLFPLIALGGSAMILTACTDTSRGAWERPPWWRSRQGGHEGSGGDRDE